MVTAVRDPLCTITAPGHVCRRRDGQPLTGTNGDCWTQARAETIRQSLYDQDTDR